MKETPLFPEASRWPQRFVIAFVMGSAMFAGLMTVAFADDTSAPLTRAQVLKDLQAYRASGLAALESDESGSQIGTPAWRAARMRYLATLSADADGSSQHALTRADVIADLKAYQASGLAALERPDGESPSDSTALAEAQQRYARLTMMDAMLGRPLTRAEVQADLQIYRESGLAAFERGEGDPPLNSPAYLDARARYAALKTGNRYQTLVTELRRRGGEPG